MTTDQKTMYLIHGAVIAAIYVVLTYLAWGFDLASGAIQCRFSEALTVLPFFTPAAVPGVTIGDNSVIGAGSVVTRDIPEGVVAVGNPCRVLRPVGERDREFFYRQEQIDWENL